MADDNGNPFADDSLTNHPSVEAKPADGNPFNDPALASSDATQPTTAQLAYRKATASGPFTPAGAAERAMGQTIGDNKAQAVQGLKDVGQAALTTGAGVVGASVVPEILPAAERVLQISENALEHLGENYPQLTKLAAKLGYGVGAAGAYKLLNKLGLH
jgi:hypothetical protein